MEQQDSLHTTELNHTGKDLETTKEMEDCDSKLRLSRVRRSSVLDSYLQFISTKGTILLSSFKFIRDVENYTKGHYFSKQSLKDQMLVWQQDDIPRSLVRLSTLYCGNNKRKSKIVKERAKYLFKHIRSYMGDLNCENPVSLAFEVIIYAVQEPLLRDEIFCQLIKQTTKNPSNDSVLLGLKLFYLCISTFKPSNDLISVIMSHLSQFAHPRMPASRVVFATIADAASNCFLIYESTTRSLSGSDTSAIPNIQDIKKITDTLYNEIAATINHSCVDLLLQQGNPFLNNVSTTKV
jgi:hypothetical protein